MFGHLFLSLLTRKKQQQNSPVRELCVWSLRLLASYSEKDPNQTYTLSTKIDGVCQEGNTDDLNLTLLHSCRNHTTQRPKSRTT